MDSNVFVPEKINIGFQNRPDTYTQKLAYIIYFDQKGVLRKESSWQSWRDKGIDNQIFTNEKTSGFVLNKKVGDYKSDWNHRQAYVRVYDPRNFEFEITIENLLYILENTSSIKGKGLEGEFVYGWYGKDLILLPVNSPDYKEIKEFNALVHSHTHIKAKELILGATYRHKNNDNYIYMGRYNYYENNWVNNGESETFIDKGLRYYFIQDKDIDRINRYNLLCLGSLGDKFLEVVNQDCVVNYAEIFGGIEKTSCYSPLDSAKDKYIPFTLEEFTQRVSNYGGDFYDFNMKLLRSSSFNKTRETMSVWHPTPNGYYGSRADMDELSIEEAFKKYKPMYRDKYLKNGKLYESGKGK